MHENSHCIVYLFIFLPQPGLAVPCFTSRFCRSEVACRYSNLFIFFRLIHIYSQLTHTNIHSFTHPFTHPFTHSLIHSEHITDRLRSIASSLVDHAVDPLRSLDNVTVMIVLITDPSRPWGVRGDGRVSHSAWLVSYCTVQPYNTLLLLSSIFCSVPHPASNVL